MTSVTMTIEFQFDPKSEELKVLKVSQNGPHGDPVDPTDTVKKPSPLKDVPLCGWNPQLIIFHHGSPGYVTYYYNGKAYKIKVPQ